MRVVTDSDDSDSMCLIQNYSTSLTDSLKERKKTVELCVHTMCHKCKMYFGKYIYIEGVESRIHYSLHIYIFN